MSTLDRNLAFVILFAAVMLSIGLIRESKTERLLKNIRTHAADQEWVLEVREIMSKFSTSYPVIGTWSINDLAKESEINIYVIDSAKIGGNQLAEFRNNCHYLGDGRRIVCDVQYIREFIARYDLDKREEIISTENGSITGRQVVPETSDLIAKHQRSILMWVLGHELGHLLGGHIGAKYFLEHYFIAEDSEQEPCIQVEFEADAFLITLARSDERVVEELYLFAYELLNREIRRRACPDIPVVAYCENIYPGTGLAITSGLLEFRTINSHPDYIVRLLNLLEEAQKIEDFGLLAYQAKQLLENGLTEVIDQEVLQKTCSVKKQLNSS